MRAKPGDRIILAGELVDVLPLELEPGATATRILDHTSAGGGELVAMEMVGK